MSVKIYRTENNLGNGNLESKIRKGIPVLTDNYICEVSQRVTSATMDIAKIILKTE